MRIYLKRFFSAYKSILTDFFSSIGAILLIIKAIEYINIEAVSRVKESIFPIAILLIPLVYSIYMNIPKKSFSYPLRERDNFIEVTVGDAFKNDGALIIPINDHFDVSLGENVKDSGSLQSQLIENFYSNKSEHLKADIDKSSMNKEVHDIGTVIEINQKNKKFYLLANSKKKKNNRVKSTKDDFILSVSKVFEYIANCSGRNESVTIPLINTGHGRISNLNKSTAIKDIIHIGIVAYKELYLKLRK